MELRPELRPPALDPELIARLTDLANRLDGALRGMESEDLAEFNRLAKTDLPFEDFQGIYKSEDPEDFVRRVLFQQSLTPTLDLTHAEMTEIVSRVKDCQADHDFYLELFLVNCKHRSGTDLIYWSNLVPEIPQDREPTAGEIATVAMQGRR